MCSVLEVTHHCGLVSKFLQTGSSVKLQERRREELRFDGGSIKHTHQQTAAAAAAEDSPT